MLFISEFALSQMVELQWAKSARMRLHNDTLHGDITINISRDGNAVETLEARTDHDVQAEFVIDDESKLIQSEYLNNREVGGRQVTRAHGISVEAS